MDEYIKRQAIRDALYDADAITMEGVKILNQFPAADVIPVRHGRWELKRHKLFGNSYDYVCSVCGCDYALAEYDYCPHCGAKMRLED